MPRPLAAYQDLCVDAVDPMLLGRFWAATLGRTLGRDLERRADGMVLLTGRTPQHTVWVNRVPEPLDLHTFRWQVLRDPEGGELCVFEREQVPDERLYEVVVDSADPERIASWWADVLGGRRRPGDDCSWYLHDVPGLPFAYFVFGPVPEPKTVKNRIHWDVRVPDVAALTAHGARLLRPQDDEIGWSVLADPEGNEFCAFVD